MFSPLSECNTRRIARRESMEVKRKAKTIVLASNIDKKIGLNASYLSVR